MLHTSKVVCMQRLQASARSYSHYVSGSIDHEKFAALVAKFARVYETDLSPPARSRAKKKGFAVAQLIAWKSPQKIFWWLLISKGRGVVWSQEIPRDLHVDRIEIAGGYELVHDSRTWTWKYKEAHVQNLRLQIRFLVSKKKDPELKRLITQLYSTAGFRLCRQQAGRLVAQVRADWHRCRGSEAPPAMPQRMLYVRMLPNENKEPASF